ncbi:MAG: SH3 domain-containing protein [Bacteroidales bacterium]|nr:SH3 domain-containing protein [Bacteroidales bacterium]
MKKINYLILIFSAFIFACGSNGGNKIQQEDNETNFEKKQTVCIWNGVPVRETPTKDGKWVSSISLGETVTFLGGIAIDSLDKNREYLHVELSDGKVAWANSYGLIIDSKIAVLKEEAPIYKRPDLLTITEKRFSKMDVLAIEETKEEWIKVVGEKKKLKGWIKSNTVIESKEDIALSIMVSKELKEKNGDLKIDDIDEFIEKSPYQNSIFISYLKEILAESKVVDEVLPDETVETDSISETIE